MLIIILMIAALPLWNCSGGPGTAHVTVNLGLPAHASFQAAPTAFERICALLPFFPTRAIAAAPDLVDITGVRLDVTQGGSSIFSENFAPTTTSVSADVPSGSGLTITATVIMDPANASAVLEYAGSANVDLAAGDDVTIAIQMMASETKIVVPDYYNNRVKQVTYITSPMNGALHSTATFNSPMDIAFDAQGRIYVASANGLQRIDTISSIETMPYAAESAVTAVAINRAAGLLYYADGNGSYLIRSDLDGEVNTNLDLLDRIADITGIAIANDGTLYLSGTDGGYPAIIHYNPSSQAILGSYTDSEVLQYIPQHILYKDSSIYAIHCNDDIALGEIVILSPALAFRDTAGSVNHDAISGISSDPMVFHHPIHFVAILNRKFTLMDNDTYSNYDRIVSFDNMSGDNWQAYADMGSAGSTSNFDFYSYSIYIGS